MRTIIGVTTLAAVLGGCGGASFPDLSGLAGVDPGEGSPQPEGLVVTPVAETEPVGGFGDAADDPAIWVNPTNPEQSLILGTDKTNGGGLYVWNLDGSERQVLKVGALNNVDVRNGFLLGGETVALVGATDPVSNTIEFFVLDPATLEVSEVGPQIDTPPQAYGFCLYHSAVDDAFYAFANTEPGIVQQYRLTDGGNEVGFELVREFCIPSQPEGMVADDELGWLYVGEERIGLWKFAAEPTGAAPGKELPECDTAIPGVLVDDTFDGNLTRDVEGITLTDGPDGGYLIASAQGAHTFVMYERQGDNAFVKEFAVWGGGDECVDGTSETDGIAATSANLGPAFPGGLMVVQDDSNNDPISTQNFKLLRFDHAVDEVFVEGPETCSLADFGGTAWNIPVGPERTPEFCETFCGKCDTCYQTAADEGFAEGDCHYLSPKPIFVLQDCIDGCAFGVVPGETWPLVEGWETWECLAFDDGL